jgi:hypothetical protein
MPSDYNVDVRLRDANDASRVQFINMTANVVPPEVVRGSWRGASVFVPSSGGEFEWDGQTAHFFDGTVASRRIVLDLVRFADSSGQLPQSGATGSGMISDGNEDPDRPVFIGDVTWEIT